MSSDKYNFKWNDYESKVSSSFKAFRNKSDYFDVTLISDGNVQISAHKLVLSTCSGFFQSVFQRNPHQHPLIYLSGVSSANLNFIMDFIYHGEVEVNQEQLGSFLYDAHKLQIQGLNTDILQKNRMDEENDDTVAEASFLEASMQSTEKQIDKFQGNASNNLMANSTSELQLYELSFTQQKAIENRAVTPPSTSYQLVKAEDTTRSANISKSDSYTVRTENLTDNETHSKLEKRLTELTDKIEGIYSCKVCGKTAKSKTHVRNHIEIHIEGLSFPCALCDGTFKSKTRHALRCHMNRYHRYETQGSQQGITFEP